MPLGTWKLESALDPRFNMQGRGDIHALEVPLEARELLNKKISELGLTSYPADLEYVYLRDPLPGEKLDSSLN